MQSMKARGPLTYHEFLELTSPTLNVNKMNQGLLSMLNFWLVLSSANCLVYGAHQMWHSSVEWDRHIFKV